MKPKLKLLLWYRFYLIKAFWWSANLFRGSKRLYLINGFYFRWSQTVELSKAQLGALICGLGTKKSQEIKQVKKNFTIPFNCEFSERRAIGQHWAIFESIQVKRKFQLPNWKEENQFNRQAIHLIIVFVSLKCRYFHQNVCSAACSGSLCSYNFRQFY